MFAGSTYRLLAGCVFTVLLAYACWSDLRSRRIPNRLVLVLAVGGVLFSVTSMPVAQGLLRSVSGLLVGLAIWMPFYVMRLLGGGDVKLLAAAGAWLGVAGTVRASVTAALAGGLLAILAVLWQRQGRQFLSWIALQVMTLRAAPAPAPPPGSFSSRKLPYGLALAAGAAFAAWFPG